MREDPPQGQSHVTKGTSSRRALVALVVVSTLKKLLFVNLTAR
jgi:hypothetical protein